MLRLSFIVILAALLGSCGQKAYIVESHFDEVVVPKAPDYTKREHWAALPDKKDAADSIPLRSDLLNRQDVAAADVFFVYPTIFTEKPSGPSKWNVDLNDEKLIREIQEGTILNQASIFNGSCRVYSPHYRQAHLSSFYTTQREDASKALNLAYEDVKKAFQYYLDHYNNGRPIVIASHSQGSYHAMRLLQDFFDGKALQKQLVVAYLVGRAIPVDTFLNIKPCSD